MRRKQADANMGEFGMTRRRAEDLIEKARKGLPVDMLDLQRATMIAYKGKEPKKFFIPVLNAARRMALNAVLLHNIGNARYKQLKEKYDAGTTANTSEDEPSALCQVDHAVVKG